jgi:iron complex outermembrane receptor protein
MIGNRFDALYKHKLFWRDNRVVVGFDINRTDFLSNRNGFPGSQTVDAFAPPEISFFSVPGVIPKFRARDVKIDQWSVFLEDQFSVTRAFKLVAGLRYDNIEASFVRTDAGPTPIAYEKKWSPLGSRVGVVYDWSSSLTWYGLLTQGSEPVGTTLLLTQANINFELTKGRMIETGLKGDFWGKRGDWMASVYRIVKKDVLVPITTSVTEQAGQQSSRGIEVSLGVRPTNALKLEANAAVLRAQFDTFNENVGGAIVSRAGKAPQNVPERVFNLGARYAIVPGVETSAWARHVGKRFTDTANTIEMPAYTVLDLSLGYRFAPRMGVELWVRNATDKLYAQFRGASNSQVILGMPRTFEVVFRGRF